MKVRGFRLLPLPADRSERFLYVPAAAVQRI